MNDRLDDHPDDHWLTRASTIKQLRIGALVVLAATVLMDLAIDHHPYFGLDGTPGFGAWFGFAACVAMIVFANALGAVLKRPDTYYDS
jgi:hypothetical protein